LRASGIVPIEYERRSVQEAVCRGGEGSTEYSIIVFAHTLFGSSPKSVIEDEAFLVQRLASEVAGLNPRFI
jgi:hypothetical protein